MLNETENKLRIIQNAVQFAYTKGYGHDEQMGPRFCAAKLVFELREAIIQECILARGRGVVDTALLIDSSLRSYL